MEELFRLGRWDNAPSKYRVVSRTAKTYKVTDDAPRYTREHTVRSANIGVDWFTSEREAWLQLLGVRRLAVEYAKAELQRKRTSLGMVESEVNRRGYAEAQDAATSNA
jgi:hypothetical protein